MYKKYKKTPLYNDLNANLDGLLVILEKYTKKKYAQKLTEKEEKSLWEAAVKIETVTMNMILPGG